MGEGGILRSGFLARLGKSGVERLTVYVTNSTDTDGAQGVLACHVSENGGASIYTDRGVALIGGTDATSDEFKQVGAKQGTSGKGMAYDFSLISTTLRSPGNAKTSCQARPVGHVPWHIAESSRGSIRSAFGFVANIHNWITFGCRIISGRHRQAGSGIRGFTDPWVVHSPTSLNDSFDARTTA